MAWGTSVVRGGDVGIMLIFDSSAQALNAAAHVPYRMHYRSGLRQVTVSYKNQPIIADSPLSQGRMTDHVQLEAVGSADSDVLAEYHYANNIEAAKIPGLKFGRRYEFAMFAVTNSGKLPQTLADPLSPCRLRLAGFTNPPPGSKRIAPYQRKVKVGSLRIFDISSLDLKNQSDVSKRNSQVVFPQIPKNVSPRARDIEVLNSGGTKLPVAGAEVAREELPLILLDPLDWKALDPSKINRFEFLVKVPTTGWECWDYWKFGEDAPDQFKREKVLADYYRTIKFNRKAPKGSEKEAQLDDPALEPRLYFELWREKDGELERVENERRRVDIPPAAGAGLSSERKPGIRVLCENAGDGEGLDLLGEEMVGGIKKPNGVRVKVKKGEVYRLTVCACLKTAHLQPPADTNRTQPFADKVVEAYGTEENGTITLVSPTHILLEVASEELPSSGDLWAAFNTKFYQDSEDGKWKITTVLEGAGGAFRYLHRTELQRQVWRWQGRVTETHPELEKDYNLPGDEHSLQTSIQRWEAVEFGDRPESDHVVLDMAVSKGAKRGGTRKFIYDEVLGENEGKYELRGLHFRFALRAFSRYEGIIPQGLPQGKGAHMDASEKRPDDPGKSNTQVTNRWKSQFVPSRKKVPVDVPKIRMVMPLTESFTKNAGASPGLLVVLNETWHEVGGLGETLEAEVVMTPDHPPGKPPKHYFEFGPDPIITNDPAKRIKPQGEGSTQVTFKEGTLVGPVGHYFDRDNTSALFVGTSFILPPPQVPLVNPNLAWYFAKLRFRRSLIVRYPETDAAKAAYKPDSTWKRREVKSDFTDPMWVQYLPEFSIYGDPALDVSKLRLQIISGNKIAFLNEADKSVDLQPPTGTNNTFSLYVVLTRKVFDVTGSSDQEAYQGIFKQCGGEWTLIEGNPASQEGGEFRARVIEVQAPKQHPSGNPADPCNSPPGAFNFWEELFGKDGSPQNNFDVRARIVRISEPIESGQRMGPCGSENV